MAGKIVLNETTEIIWDFLLEFTENEFGTAAIMGNLMAECSMNPACATGKNKVENYVQAADNCAIDFVHDGVAFGLVQWCFWSRKEALINYAKSTGRSVGDLQMQLERLVMELANNYKNVWNTVRTAVDIQTASDAVMLKYEKPATTTEAARKKRADYGQAYYEAYGQVEEPDKKLYVVATSTVRIRAGDGTEYPIVGRMTEGKRLEWVADSSGFHAVRTKDRVGWVSGEFSKVVEE